MRNIAVALSSVASLALALGCAGAAHAADDWTGPYVGATIGMSVAQTNSVEGYLDYEDYSEGHITANSVSGNVGVNAGYNKQFGSVVLGAEADVNYLGNSSSNRVYDGDVSVKSMVSGLGMLKFRAGIAHDNWLVYVTGGPALMVVRHKSGWPGDSETCSGTGKDLDYTSCVDGAKLGLAIGGGVQAKLTKKWSVKAEYLYVDGPAYHTTYDSYQYSWQDSVNLARVGLVYSF
jgi:outer membrane immunogenic protein